MPLADTDLRIIDALDDAVQARFTDLNGRFGLTRLVDFNKAPHRFEPEQLRELEIVRNLQQAQLRVVIYLTGRGVLAATPPPPSSPWTPAERGADINGPILVTAKPHDSEPAPAANELRDEARAALLAFRNRDSHDFILDDWRFTTRPVRASRDACVMCHQIRGSGALETGGEPVRLGTALGVVMYGRRSTAGDLR